MPEDTPNSPAPEPKKAAAPAKKEAAPAAAAATTTAPAPAKKAGGDKKSGGAAAPAVKPADAISHQPLARSHDIEKPKIVKAKGSKNIFVGIAHISATFNTPSSRSPT